MGEQVALIVLVMFLSHQETRFIGSVLLPHEIVGPPEFSYFLKHFCNRQMLVRPVWSGQT